MASDDTAPPRAYDPELFHRALRFAAEKHAQQRFPGTELPYLLHVTMVAGELVAALPDERCEAPDLAVACALLHDTLEDTSATDDELAQRFGPAVLAGVRALSKNPALPKAEQMSDSIDRILAQPREVALVKLADRVCNLDAPPHYWTREKCEAYRDEARVLAARLGPRSHALVHRLHERIERYAR